MEAEVDLVAQDVNVEQFPHVLFPLVSVETFFCGESFSDFGKFRLHSLGLGFLIFAFADIGDKFVETTHGGAIHKTPKHSL